MIETGQRIVVVDVRIPFVRLVLFFVKVAIAAIPAAIIVGYADHGPVRRPRRRWRSYHDAAVVLSSSAEISRADIP